MVSQRCASSPLTSAGRCAGSHQLGVGAASEEIELWHTCSPTVSLQGTLLIMQLVAILLLAVFVALGLLLELASAVLGPLALCGRVF